MSYFPKAVHVVQRDEIRYAMWPDAWTRPVYCQNDFANIRKIDVMEVDGNFDLLEPSLQPSCRDIAGHALTIVRDGVITGEGPTTNGRVHCSRALDADDAAWCARILTAAAVEHQPVSRAEAEALFQISDAATERTDEGKPRLHLAFGQISETLVGVRIHQDAIDEGLDGPTLLTVGVRSSPSARFSLFFTVCRNDLAIRVFDGVFDGEAHHDD